MGKKTTNTKIENNGAKPNHIPKIALTNIQLTAKQRKLIHIFDENKIIIVTGPAGTSKTFLDCFYTIDSLKKEKFEKIILTKPIKEAGESLGFLPGEIEDKIGPYYQSFEEVFLSLIRDNTYNKLREKNVIDYRPLAYMRGISMLNSLAILDEAQNCNWKQLMLFITRMGKDSKIIISGDISQYDINRNMLALNGLRDMIKDIPGVATFEFDREDIMRDKILIEITDRYEKAKYSGKIKEER